MTDDIDLHRLIADFLSAGPFAVAGASNDRTKYGNRVLRAYVDHGLEVYPIHPKEKTIEGLTAYPDIASLPKRVRGLSIVTPPAVTEGIVEEAARSGVTRLWMQPGAESQAAIDKAAMLGLSLIAGGPCVLVALAQT